MGFRELIDLGEFASAPTVGLGVAEQFARKAGEKIADVPPAKVLDTRLLPKYRASWESSSIDVLAG